MFNLFKLHLINTIYHRALVALNLLNSFRKQQLHARQASHCMYRTLTSEGFMEATLMIVKLNSHARIQMRRQGVHTPPPPPEKPQSYTVS